MTAYAITGTVSPDCTTENTGEPAGQYNGQDYWSWTNDAGTWYLWFRESKGVLTWYISVGIGTTIPATWMMTGSISPAGLYLPGEPYAGPATVAEYVPPATDPTLKGSLFLMISHVNGIELGSPKMIQLAEFDE